jgi:hypothetical protein|tara:strand:+ start:42 stop:290 length:249 start_codon:yes stop_codon:yes gene_type:complete
MVAPIVSNAITSILTNTRTAAQSELIQTAAEMAEDMPDIIGYAIVMWDANDSLSFVEPWPYSPADVGTIIKENVNDFLTSED